MTISLFLLLAACSQDAIPTSVTGPEQNQLVAVVGVQPTEVVLPPDEVLQLTAVVKGARGQTVNGRPVTWSSSDETVAYVDAGGSIVAGDEGTAVITANVLGVKGHATVDVRGEVIDIVVDGPAVDLAQGDVETLSATYVYSNGARRSANYVRWTTSDPTIVWVDGDGEITARDAGEVTVTAEGRGQVGGRQLKVAAGHISSVTVHASATILAVGEEGDVWAVILNNKGMRVSRQVTWSSSDPSVVRVTADGRILAIAPGTETVTASVSGTSGSIDITVVNGSSGTTGSTIPVPGRVADLSVVETGETSMGLRFTEVDDGTGAPASYLIRYAEAGGFDWNTGLDVTKGSCAAPLIGSGSGSVITCSVGGLQSATDYVFQLVAFRTSDGSNVYGSLSNLATGRTQAPGIIVDVLPSSFQIDVGQQKQLSASVTDTYGNPLNQSVTWSSSASTVASVTSSGLVTGNSSGNTTVRASAIGASDTSAGTVVQQTTSQGSDGGGSTSGGSGGSGGSGTSGAVAPNEPAGFTRVTERPFSAMVEDGWEEVNTANASIQQDPTAPISPSGVYRVLYPAGRTGGTNMGNRIQRVYHGTGYQENYISFWVKYDPNFQNHTAGSKIFFNARTHHSGAPYKFVVAGGGTTNPLRPEIRLGGQDNQPCGYGVSRNLYQNRGSAQFVRGQWHHVEVYSKLNTRAVTPTCDGVVRMWVDGQLVLEHTDVLMLDPDVIAADWEWGYLNFAPTWGGVGDTVIQDTWFYVDHFYISGR